jgi:hypothetical protein
MRATTSPMIEIILSLLMGTGEPRGGIQNGPHISHDC